MTRLLDTAIIDIIANMSLTDGHFLFPLRDIHHLWEPCLFFHHVLFLRQFKKLNCISKIFGRLFFYPHCDLCLVGTLYYINFDTSFGHCNYYYNRSVYKACLKKQSGVPQIPNGTKWEKAKYA